MRTRAALLVAAGLALAATGCADDPGGIDGAPATFATPVEGGLAELPADPGYRTCDVVPVEIVNRTLGLELPAGTPRANDDDPRVCQYGTLSFDGTGDVLVAVYVGQDVAQAEAIFDDVVFIVSARPFAGPGDEAAEAIFSSRVVVRQGNVVVDVYAESGQARLGSETPELAAAAAEILGTAVGLPGAQPGGSPAP